MSIVIYTYQNPYKLKDEPFWAEITTCPYFCASQTLANGLRSFYGDDFSRYNLRTVKNLTDSLYTWWESTSCAIKQNAAIDNFINHEYSGLDVSSGMDNIRRAFLFNRDEVFKSIRTLFELDVEPGDILCDRLSPEQKFIVSLYQSILETQSAKLFRLVSHLEPNELDVAIANAVSGGEEQDVSPSDIPDRVVVHGVHQFSPLILRAIEELSKYKKVILLFCYQLQYGNVYQSWVDIYSSFDFPITFLGTQEPFHPIQDAVSYRGNVLADNLGKLAEGDIAHTNQSFDYEMIEFDNVTEFAGYVADIYESARRVIPDMPLRAMKEQFYAADMSVNEILKTYFPEQFGERQFLNYPLGHFFVAIANMWDVKSNSLQIDDINDVRECLMAGILQEDYRGELSTLFERALALFEGCESINEMVKRLKSLKTKKRRVRGAKAKQVGRISYYSLSNGEITKLVQALEDLQGLSLYFYEDFERRPNNFRSFYERLKEYLHDEILGSRDLDREFEDIVRRVYLRIEEVDGIDASASFECLKSTMSIYLTQQEVRAGGANWIVKGFEQVDGDIMQSARSHYGKDDVVYHFACLSDEDVNSIAIRDFPWPLDEEFFTVAQSPVDWKYQVFVKSRKEYRHFKAYALLYGLEFNRAKFKLSYIKRDGEKEKNPYTRLMMLGVRIRPYDEVRLGRRLADASAISVGLTRNGDNPFDEMDRCRLRICGYRFLLESIVEKGSVFKDSFLLSKYMEALLENKSKEDLEGMPGSKPLILDAVNDNISGVSRDFPFVSSASKIDAVNGVVKRLERACPAHGFPAIGEQQRRNMRIREEFLHKHLRDRYGHDVLEGKFEVTEEEDVREALSSELLRYRQFSKECDDWCTYCPNREVCLAAYKQIG